jgi:hypothetical protein
MTICAVIDLETNELVNTIVAEPTIEAPLGCKLIEIPENYYWDGQQVSRMPIGVDDGS